MSKYLSLPISFFTLTIRNIYSYDVLSVRSLLQKQEREFKIRLAKLKRRLQLLKTKQRHGTAEEEPMMKVRRLTTQTDDGEISEVETETDNDSEHSTGELDDDSSGEMVTKCSSCARTVPLGVICVTTLS